MKTTPLTVMEERDSNHYSTGEPFPETAMSEDLSKAIQALRQKLQSETAQPKPPPPPQPKQEPVSE